MYKYKPKGFDINNTNSRKHLIHSRILTWYYSNSRLYKKACSIPISSSILSSIQSHFIFRSPSSFFDLVFVESFSFDKSFSWWLKSSMIQLWPATCHQNWDHLKNHLALWSLFQIKIYRLHDLSTPIMWCKLWWMGHKFVTCTQRMKIVWFRRWNHTAAEWRL